MEDYLSQLEEAADYIRSRTGGESFHTGLILGSGLGDIADRLEDRTVVPYSDIPHFVRSTAEGHKGNLVAGRLGGKPVCALQGRFHHYEGYDSRQVTFPVRVLRLLGVKQLFVSNASGALNGRFRTGDIMVITDHINLLPNPLVGPNAGQFGPRFPDMLDAYDPELVEKAFEVASQCGIRLVRGVYLATSGPSYETQAEYNFFKLAGADAVGMSTTPEVIVARHCGISVFGVSVITAEAHDTADDYHYDSAEVLKAAGAASLKLTTIFSKLIESA